MLSEGEEAPDFELENQDGEPVRLSGLRGSPVVLYFYPKADTPGCTTQACGIRDRRADYDAAGAVVLGVSPDEPAKLRRFADKHGLPFTLLADADHEVAERYGTWVERKPGVSRRKPGVGGGSPLGKKRMGVQRATFVIDPEGRVAHVVPKVSPKTHDDVVLEALAAA